MLQQFPLSTSKIASCFYPARGKASARNDPRLMGAGVGESRFSPLRSPIAGIIFYENCFFKMAIYFIKSNS